MKLIKSFLIVAIIASGFNSYAQNWQGGGGGGYQQLSPEDRAYNQTKQMKKLLTLSKEQFEKVEVINVKYAMMMDSTIKANGGFSPEMREKMKPMMEAKDKELKPILTEEQMKLYEENKKKMYQQGGGRPQNK
jgi:periplasmic protein CpxP/Spy